MPTLDPLRIEIQEQTLTGFGAAIHLVLKNPTEEELKVSGGSFEVHVDGQPRGASKVAATMAAPAGGEAPVVLSGASAEIAKSAEDVGKLADRRALDVLVKGTLSVTGAGGKTWEIPFSRVGQARTPRLPRIEMHQIQVTRSSETEVDLTFYLGVDNPNPFEVPVVGLTYALTVGGKAMGEEKMTAKGDKLPRSAQAIYDLPAPLNGETFGPTLAARLKAADLDFALTGTLDLGIVQLPVELTGPVPISK